MSNPFAALVADECGSSGGEEESPVVPRVGPTAVAAARALDDDRPLAAAANRRTQKKAKKRAKRQKREEQAARPVIVEDEDDDDDDDDDADGSGGEEEDGSECAGEAASGSGTATSPSEVGLTAGDISSAARTLGLLEANPRLLEHASLRALRVALAPLVTRLGAKFGVGGSAAARKAKRPTGMSAREAAQLEYELALDASARNATALRATRLKKLETLNSTLDPEAAAEAARVRAFRVPDGVAITDGRSEDVCMRMLTDGSAESAPSGARLLLTAGGNTDAASNATPDTKSTTASTGTGARLIHPAKCYTCKAPYKELHHFYDSLCPECAALNFAKRGIEADMTGKIVLLTGARVKIGYRILCKLLRCGAFVVATTRFPHDLSVRLRLEHDFASWRSRVHIYGLDFRNLPVLEQFVALMYDKYTHLDAIINNACQTVRRPPAFYAHLLEAERVAFENLAPEAQPLLQAHHEFAGAAYAAPDTARLGSGTGGSAPRLTSGSEQPIAPRTGGATITVVDAEDEDEDMRAEEIVAEAARTKAATIDTTKKTKAAASAPTPAPAPAASTATNASGQPQASKKRSRRGAMRAAETSASPQEQAVVPVGQGGPLTASALAAESTQLALLPSDDLSAAEHAALFPTGERDVNGQQVDLRATNSWTMKLEDVPIGEAAEVMSVNMLAPFLLNSKLKALMVRGNEAKVVPRFIVNVSAMEGKFYRYKSSRHPHTNAAKAALNMMTRTSAQDYIKANIFMTAVDTGWINDENPLPKAAQIAAKHNFQTPLDEVDAAMRVLDPILTPLKEFAEGAKAVKDMKIPYGIFIKDYVKCEW